MWAFYLLFFIISFFTAIILTPIIRNIGTHLGVMDFPNIRKIHENETPSLGGIVIFIAILLPFICFLGVSPKLYRMIEETWRPLIGLALGGLIVLGCGIWDDIRRLPPLPKLLLEIIAALVAFYFDLKIQLLSNPFGLQFNVAWLSVPLTVIWLVTITNAINLADGIDGLATGIAAFVGLILFSMTISTSYSLVPFLAVSLVGASVGFLRYNFSPATIFLGDSGSLFIGFYLGGLSLWASEKSTIAFALLIPIIALGLPIIDMIYTIVRRWHNGVPISQADKEHIHHKLLEKGFSHRHTVLLLYGVNLVLFVMAGLLLFTRNSLAAYIIVLLGLGMIAGPRILGYVRFIKIISKLNQRRKNSQKSKQLTFRVRLVQNAFKKTKTLPERWDLATGIFQEMGLSEASFFPEGSLNSDFKWVSPNPASPENKNEAKLTIFPLGDKGPAGSLELKWSPSLNTIPPGMNSFLDLMTNNFCLGLKEGE